MMPTETPQGTRSCTAPSSRASGRPCSRSSASSTAVSSAALAIRWPLNAASAGPTAYASSRGTAASAGIRKRRSTSATASTYSGEYRGLAIATHSPQPSATPVTTRTSRMSRSVSVPNEVLKGVTSGMLARRSSTPSIFMAAAPRGRG